MLPVVLFAAPFIQKLTDGDVGYGEKTGLGDAVNVAAMTRYLECQVLVSDELYKGAGLADDPPTSRAITVRGRAATVRTIANAENLATMLEPQQRAQVVRNEKRTPRAHGLDRIFGSV